MIDRELWDVVVVGAGPAGSVVARQLALHGAQVLLIDKAIFPRDKVCGCCVNQAALSTLESIGLGDLPRQLGAQAIGNVQLFAAGGRSTLSLPGGVSVSRRALDMALIKAAVAAGAHFEPRTFAKLDRMVPAGRILTLGHEEGARPVTAKLVIAADGLGGRLLQDEPTMRTTIAKCSRIGAGTIAEEAPAFYRTGSIYMACARHGYVGLVRLEDNRLNIAAALDPAFLRRADGPGAAAGDILCQVGLPGVPRINDLRWQGTALLTRRRSPVAAHRLFVLGDAAGYVEPFTGEGIAWALASACAAAPLAWRAAQAWDQLLAKQWTYLHHRLLGRRQHVCRFMATLLRHPMLTAAMIKLLVRMPGVAGIAVTCINRPFRRPVCVQL